MNKKYLLILALVVLVAGGVFGQEEWWTSYSPAVADSTLLVNVGIGLGSPTRGLNMGIPPVSASVDLVLPVPLPITVGAVAMFTSWKYSENVDVINVTASYRNIGIGVRGMYHFNFLEALDTYAGLTVGYVIQSAKVKTSGAPGNHSARAAGNFVLWGLNIGGRYYFNELIGAYVELGYNSLQFLGIGATFRL